MTAADDNPTALDTALALELLETIDAIEAGDLSLRDGSVVASIRRGSPRGSRTEDAS